MSGLFHCEHAISGILGSHILDTIRLLVVSSSLRPASCVHREVTFRTCPLPANLRPYEVINFHFCIITSLYLPMDIMVKRQSARIRLGSLSSVSKDTEARLQTSMGLPGCAGGNTICGEKRDTR